MIADKANVQLNDGREFIADHNPLETFIMKKLPL